MSAVILTDSDEKLPAASMCASMWFFPLKRLKQSITYLEDQKYNLLPLKKIINPVDFHIIIWYNKMYRIEYRRETEK